MINAILIAATVANPVLHFDFSDPDVCVGKDGRVYMAASSFGGLPGIPVIASEDLVNWKYVSYAIERHPFETLSPEHGNSVWAPSIRYRADKDEYVIYWGDPDRGAYRVSAKSPEGPWGEPRLVIAARGMIDVCPLYDDDGRIYLVNAWANSRAGMNSVLTVRELDADETREISAPVMVYDGVPDGNFTTEGPKFYKKDGEYWLFFPAGGVGGGWQVAARAKSPYGPYEVKKVLEQGDTSVNGPHQGGAVRIENGKWKMENEWWFYHFSDRDAYGRIVYLEPMKWEKGEWPVIGDNGKPMENIQIDESTNRRIEQLPFSGLAVSDEFDAPSLGLQWQFLGRGANHAAWPTPYGYFRLYSTAFRSRYASCKSFVSSSYKTEPDRNLWKIPNLMVQKFPAANFTATVKAQVGAKQNDEDSGLVVMGRSYARLGLKYHDKFFDVVYVELADADKEKCEGETKPTVLATIPATVIGAGIRTAQTCDIYLRLEVRQAKEKTHKDQLCPPPICTFSWSTDGETWHAAPRTFEARVGKWIGATFGFYAVNEPDCKDRGWIDLDWLRVE